MLRFHGFCSYPHGGWTMLSLIICCIAAMGASMYGISSCRFAYVQYSSDRGDFGTMFVDPTADGEAITRRTGVGLFTWLKPFDENFDWTEGVCRGYSRLHLENIADDMFEASRIFGVLSVLGGISMALSTLFLACISYNRFQIWLMSGALLGLTVFNGATFLFLDATVCTDLVRNQRNDSLNDPSIFTSSCTLDQGALIVMAAAILWFVASLISIVYVRPIQTEVIIVNGRIANAYEERLKARAIRQQQRRREQQPAHRGGGSPPSKSPRQASSTPIVSPRRPTPAVVTPTHSPGPMRSPGSYDTDDDDYDDDGEPPRIRLRPPPRSTVITPSVQSSDTEVEMQLQRLRKLATVNRNRRGDDYDSGSDSSFEV